MICMHSVDKTILILFSIFVSVMCDNVQGKNESEKIVYPNDFRIEQHSHSSHQRSHRDHRGEVSSDFQHSSEFHYGDPNFISSNTGNHSTTDNNDQRYWNGTTKYIPLEFIKIINEHNISDLLRDYIEDDKEYDKEITLLNRFGGEASERSESPKDAAKIAKAAGCSPEVQTIQLKNDTDPSILYIPQCTKVERCSGCCTHPLLSCQPNQTEILTYQVLKTQYNGEKKLKLLGKELVLIEKHISCKCDCKLKEESCNKYQEYRHSECQCVCTNTDEEKKCYKNDNKKLWNPEVCACQCRNIFECSTGQYFDHNECKCLTTQIRRRFAAITSPPEAPPILEDYY